MVENWITSPAGRKVIGTFADTRPAWLWSSDGKKLIWCNPAARLRGAKIKRHRLKLASNMIPIKGQVARLMRLGALGRSSLSRMQFTVGSKPISATCTCTPMILEDSARALMIVGVDPIDRALMAEHWGAKKVLADIFGSETLFAVYDEDGDLVAGEHYENAHITMPAGPNGETIAFFEQAEVTPSEVTPTQSEETNQSPETVQLDVPIDVEPDVSAVDDTPHGDVSPSPDAQKVATENTKMDSPKHGGDLSILLEKLAGDQHLFEPLSDSDDAPFVQSIETEPSEAIDDGLSDGGSTGATATREGGDQHQTNNRLANDDSLLGADKTIENSTEQEVDADQLDTTSNAAAAIDEIEMDDGLWQVIGRGFDRHLDPQSAKPVEPAEDDQPSQIADAPDGADVAEVEQTSRYNFAELSRILNDRIAGERAEIRNEGAVDAGVPTAGELVSLTDESLVLNRLPLGLLIFRDQQVLFVNRTMTDLVGYPDSASLRAEGLEAIFPQQGNDDDPLGPVTHLAHRNGERVPVSARLQAINWQGAPALMLTARTQAPVQGTEGAIRTFAEQFAAMQGCGYFETSRAGIISSISGRGADLFGRTPQVLIGRPLMLMADHEETAAMRVFLEQAARKAETTRPSILLRGTDPRLKIYVFAEGQAGLVTGYFGLVQRSDDGSGTAVPATNEIHTSNIDPAVLTRLSRNIRRPLNSIIGFAELLQSHAFGPIENTRYVEYARDIKLSGREIVRSVDELEEFVRIDSGDYLVAPLEFDLANLLDTSISRVRAQASQARVFVRSAISEHLPRIRADEASLGQAILNLLASAIEQTPPGGHVVVSAQREDDGSVAVHVRDSGAAGGDIAERFVVFREDNGAHETGMRAQGSSVGLALTRSLLAINTCTLAIEAGAGHTTILSLFIPAELATQVQ